MDKELIYRNSNANTMEELQEHMLEAMLDGFMENNSSFRSVIIKMFGQAMEFGLDEAKYIHLKKPGLLSRWREWFHNMASS